VITQDSILDLIRKQEADIEKLRSFMKEPEPTIDVAIRARESFIRELRGLL
jgi:hypothetical protein